MKNLLILTPSFPHKNNSIAGSFIKSQIDAFKQHFDRIVVFSVGLYIPRIVSRFIPPNRRQDISAEDYQYDNVEVFFLHSPTIPIELAQRTRGIQNYLVVERALKRLDYCPDIIHSHFIWPMGYSAKRLAQEHHIPYVVTGHGYDIYDLPFRSLFLMKTCSSILTHANYIIAVSNRIRDIIESEFKVDHSKIRVIPNGFNPEMFYSKKSDLIRKQFKINEKDIVCLSIGTLAKIKGHRYLIDAAKIIIKHRNDVYFIIIGDGTERRSLEKMINDYDLDDHIKLIGSISHLEIPLWLNDADFLALPSLNEGMPTVLFEAMACGKPCIASNVGGIPEIIIDHKNGILVPPHEPALLASAIEQAIIKKWDNDFIAQYASKYTWVNAAEEIRKIYETLSK